MKIIFRLLSVSALLFTFISRVVADPPGPPGPGGDPGAGGGVPVGAPIDSDIFVLLVLGAGYGIYRIWENSKKGAAMKESSTE